MPPWVSVFTWGNGDTEALICLCLIASVFSSRCKFISNALLLPPWVTVFTWRNGDTGALICLCLIASVFFSRYQFISNSLLLPPWVSVFTWRNGDTGALICLCLIASVFFPRVISLFRILSVASLRKRIYMEERTHWGINLPVFNRWCFFSSRYQFISNTFLLPPWVSVFTWRNGDTEALICLCLIASVFSSRCKFISNALLLPPWVTVFTWRNGDTGALICLCLIASVFFSRYQFISNSLLLPPWVSVFTWRNGDTGALICLCLIASVFFPRVISLFRILSVASLRKRIYMEERTHWGINLPVFNRWCFFSSRYQFISNTLLLPPWVSVFTWRNGDTGALICLCLIASVFFFSRVISSFRILFCCLLG